jgi:hypothetical protein
MHGHQQLQRYLLTLNLLLLLVLAHSG